MTWTEQELLAMLKERSFRRGHFKLASGGESDYYLDCRTTSVYARGTFLIGESLYYRTNKLAVDAFGGLEVGAVPLVSATVMAYERHRQPLMEGFWVRAKVKDHGTARPIEGVLASGNHVVILEDVTTQGHSALRAAQAAQDAGAQVLKVLALVDRLQGADKLLAEHGFAYESLFTIRDFGVGADDATISLGGPPCGKP